MTRFQYNLTLFFTVSLYSFLLVISGGVDALGETGNSSRQAEVVWPELHGRNFDIYYSRQTPSGWAEKIPLSDSPDTDMTPCLSSGNNGVKWAVWTADSGLKSDLFYCHSENDGWTDPKKISTGLLFNAAPSIIVDKQNRPWIVWSGSDGGGSDIFFTRWKGNDWEQASRINMADSTPDIIPLIGIDLWGNPWVCWFGFDGTRYRPYSSRWSAREWSDEVESESDNLYKVLIETGEEGGIPTLPGFVTDPDKACVYVSGSGRLQSFPIRYLSLGNLLSTAAPSGSEPITERLLSPSGALVILGFGDSITQGVPYIEDHGDGRRVGGYEPPLETLLAADSRPSRVLNWGWSGERTNVGVSRIDDALSDPDADYIFILEGTNDYWEGIIREDTIINLGLMIDKCVAQNVTPILSTLTPDTKTPEKQIPTTYNPDIKDLATQKGITLADQYEALVDGWESVPYNYDQLHPNVAGYQVMAQTWFDALPEGPSVTTGGATSIGFTAAQLNGTVNPKGSATNYHFEYGKTTYTSSTPSTSAGSGTDTIAVNAPVTGLTKGTLYHYRLRATNSGGTVYGSDRTFITPVDPPTVTTDEATSVDYESATLNGTVNPNGGPTNYHFEYGSTTAYGSSTPGVSAGSGDITIPVSSTITGLSQVAIYHFRLVAFNLGGTSYGSDKTFAMCSGDTVVLENVTFPSGTTHECVGTTSITIGTGVTIESGANVTFTAPTVNIQSGFHAEDGSTVEITVP